MKIVGVRFEPSGRVYYLDPGDLDLQPGDRVLTDVDAEVRQADVVIAPGQVIYSEVRSRSGLVLGRVVSAVSSRDNGCPNCRSATPPPSSPRE